MSNNIRRALYITEWDDGETVLESPCKVNLITHEIVDVGKRKIIQSPYDNDELDDCIEILDEQYVKFTDGTVSDVVGYNDDWSFKDKYGIAPFFIR